MDLNIWSSRSSSNDTVESAGRKCKDSARNSASHCMWIAWESITRNKNKKYKYRHEDHSVGYLSDVMYDFMLPFILRSCICPASFKTDTSEYLKKCYLCVIFLEFWLGHLGGYTSKSVLMYVTWKCVWAQTGLIRYFKVKYKAEGLLLHCYYLICEHMGTEPNMSRTFRTRNLKIKEQRLSRTVMVKF